MTGHDDPAPITAVIADDEDLARRRLLELLDPRPSIQVIAQSTTGPETLRSVRALGPDLLFLDVQMPGLDGFEVLARLAPEERPVVVFSTAYDEHALDAFDAHAIDYLLKPYSDERFEESLRHASRAVRSRRFEGIRDSLAALLEPGSGRTGPAYLDRFAVPRGNRIDVIPAGRVDWLEAAGDYVRLHMEGEAPLVRATIAGLSSRLDPGRFLRVHRSTIVQLDRIRHVEPDGKGGYTATLGTGERLRVSRSYRDALLRRLGMAI